MHRNRPETGRRAPRSLPRPRPLRLPPCRCGLFRRTQEVPRRSPATSFGRGPPRSMSGTESPQDGPSVPLERNDRPVRRGGGSELPSQWAAIRAAMLQKNVLVKATPCSSRHLCAARAQSAAGAGSANFGFLRWLRRRVIYAVCAQCGPRTGPPHAHVEARPATLWRDSLGSGRLFVGGSSGTVSRRSRAPPFGMRWACGRAVGPWAAQQVEMYLLERGDIFS